MVNHEHQRHLKQFSDTSACSGPVFKRFRGSEIWLRALKIHILAGNLKGPGHWKFRAPAHLYHQRRCFIWFSRARHSNFGQEALDPGSEFSLRISKITKTKKNKKKQSKLDPKCILMISMKTSHILKQFSNTSARYGSVFSAISRFKNLATSPQNRKFWKVSMERQKESLSTYYPWQEVNAIDWWRFE